MATATPRVSSQITGVTLELSGDEARALRKYLGQRPAWPGGTDTTSVFQALYDLFDR